MSGTLTYLDYYERLLEVFKAQNSKVEGPLIQRWSRSVENFEHSLSEYSKESKAAHQEYNENVQQGMTDGTFSQWYMHNAPGMSAALDQLQGAEARTRVVGQRGIQSFSKILSENRVTAAELERDTGRRL